MLKKPGIKIFHVAQEYALDSCSPIEIFEQLMLINDSLVSPCTLVLETMPLSFDRAWVAGYCFLNPNVEKNSFGKVEFKRIGILEYGRYPDLWEPWVYSVGFSRTALQLDIVRSELSFDSSRGVQRYMVSKMFNYLKESESSHALGTLEKQLLTS